MVRLAYVKTYSDVNPCSFLFLSDFLKHLGELIVDGNLPSGFRLDLLEVNEAIPDLVPFQIQNLFPSHAGVKTTNDDMMKMLGGHAF